MQNYYTTANIAKIIGIHPNTVRLYESLGLITKPERKQNGYRIFTNLHIEQLKIARLAFEVEILQNGLRKLAVKIIKTCAECNYTEAISLTLRYLEQVQEERKSAEKAIKIVEQIIDGKSEAPQQICMTRKEAADYLNVTIDTLRNWEMNGLITIKRKKNGYRVYTEQDLQHLTIINSLRCANYSLSAILRMLSTLSVNPEANIREAIDTSDNYDDIITACDNLLTSLNHAENNGKEILILLTNLNSVTKT
ncbi:MerR family transcriptional regulator [Anaeromicropila herbilytica]|nr:MerR family transcriptional regulator [Anaeromicropila herbilytica]